MSKVNYRDKNIYLVVGGTVTVIPSGTTRTVPTSGAPTPLQIVAGDDVRRGTLEIRLSQGRQVFSFTDG